MHFIKSILFSDYDHTLCEYGSPEVFPKNQAAIDKWRKAGNHFVIATGRGEESLRSVFRDYDAYCDYCILCDGGYVIDRTGSVIFIDKFGDILSQKLNAAISSIRHNAPYATICFRDKMEASTISADTCKIRFWFEALDDCIATEKMLANQFPEELDCISYHNAAFNDDARLPWINQSMRHIIEVTRLGTNKYTGIQKLLSATGFHDDANVTTIGDGKNDLCMIFPFDGYVVKNGDPAVVGQIRPDHRVPHLHSLITLKLLQH